jgi:hypothetical protein
MRTSYKSDRVLNTYRGTSDTAPSTLYAGLVTAVAGGRAGTVTEAAYAGYARKAVTFGAPGAGPGTGRQIANTVAVLFDAKTDVGSVDAIAIGYWDALTVGNLMELVFLDGADVLFAVGNDVPTDFLRSPAHGMANDQRVRLLSLPGAPSLPTGLAEDTTYWVVQAATDEFKLSATQGGAAINITGQGRALVMRLVPLTLNQNDQANFAIGVLKLQEG